MKINLEYIRKFNPCQSGIERYIEAGHENFNGSIVEFLELPNLPFGDKKWVAFHKNQILLSDNLMREFALLCSLRAVERVNIEEITYLYDVTLSQHILDTADFAAGYALGYAADSAAYYAACSVADSAADSVACSAACSATRYAACSATRYAAYYAACSVACSVACSAADSATYYAACSAEENIQIKILINLIKDGCTLR